MPITKANINDAAELVALVNSAYRGESSKLGWTTEAHLLEGSRIDHDTMLQYLDDAGITILKYTDDNDSIKGCVYLEIKRNMVYLGMLTVSPLLQAKGIGRRLLEAATVFCREHGCKGLTITVITTRLELIDWYIRRGFNKTGEIRNFVVPKKFGISKQPIQLLVMNKYTG